jgi:predicted ATP-binding protein involved in virulence
MKSSMFRVITPCSPLKVNRYFGGICRLRLQGKRIRQARNQHETDSNLLPACLAYYSTLKMEAICFSEMSVDFQRTTRRYILKVCIINDFLFTGINEEHGLEVYENRVLRTIFGPKRGEVIGGWIKLRNQELHS